MVEWGEGGLPLPPYPGSRVDEVSASSARTEDRSHGTTSLRRHLAEADEAFRARHTGQLGPDPC